MLLSGTDNHIAGIGSMAESLQEFQRGKPGYEGYLNDRVAALPEVLQDAGYLTIMSGKWHLGLTPDRFPVKRGFEKSFTLLPGAANHYNFEPQLRDNDTKSNLEKLTPALYAENDKVVDNETLPSGFYSSDYFTERMLGFLHDRERANDTRPFFAYYTFSAPHWPLQAPEENIQPYKGLYDDGPENLRQRRLSNLKKLGLVPEHAVPHNVVVTDRESTKKGQGSEWNELSADEKQYSSRTMEVYAGMVERMDYNIGKVIQYLEGTGELDNTFIVFMSDNGAEGALLEAIPLFGTDLEKYSPPLSSLTRYIQKYYDNSYANIGRANSYVWYGPRWAQAATAPSRLYKTFTSEGGIRVPLILRYPPLTSSTSQDGIVRSFSTVMDIFPTVLDLAGVPPVGFSFRSRKVVPIRGTSWVPFLRNQRERIHAEDHATGWELFGRLAVRKGKWKATFIPEPYGPGAWELFDLDADPGETRDLSKDELSVFKDLLREWDQYVSETGVIGVPPEYGTLRVD